jgi:hypothetical protein
MRPSRASWSFTSAWMRDCSYSDLAAAATDSACNTPLWSATRSASSSASAALSWDSAWKAACSTSGIGEPQDHAVGADGRTGPQENLIHAPGGAGGDPADLLRHERAESPHLAQQLAALHGVDQDEAPVHLRQRGLEAAEEHRHRREQQPHGGSKQDPLFPLGAGEVGAGDVHGWGGELQRACRMGLGVGKSLPAIGKNFSGAALRIAVAARLGRYFPESGTTGNRSDSAEGHHEIHQTHENRAGRRGVAFQRCVAALDPSDGVETGHCSPSQGPTEHTEDTESGLPSVPWVPWATLP